ncbi:eukaryotic translation initiation factor eIF1, putative [Talaromyces stipitatus ATCC 10500]|uniref:Eukaryotic translation initiation factor eIF1, putative n=1 Tax=Talaromyces stipitatus (strain ATCC 10500 / CBS 375.48 / QM 6759 / NRRL 1006) TaxID=441959 RepID=B8LXH3_TALSN|nr:eukaryotic translation initiation factor eIF1, putative [Talaromyces stipitatus ATCC 10500]EED23254.1 eukaryotic translation initiation factor eIF1, putative [Talaromyces stipitatus ATCC 10500]
MGPPKRKVLATAEEGLYPPETLLEGHQIARIIKATGNNLYSVEWPSKQTALVELSARFRSKIWMKRGSYVVVDTNALDGRENKIAGEIVNVVRDEKAWRKAAFWPKEFVKQSYLPSDSEDEEESRVGKMPSSDEEDDE